MPKFGKDSLAALKTCDPRLQLLMKTVIEDFDFTVLEGFRGKVAQNVAYAKGLSQVAWPFGRHNTLPSLAVDVAPYPIDWNNTESAHQRFVLLAGFVLCTAKRLKLRVRWGGDWNGDLDTRDERFRDLGHFEIVVDDDDA